MIKLNLQELLRDNNKTTYWLYKQLGLSYNSTKRLINGQSKAINFKNIEKLCSLFNCTPNELFTLIRRTKESNNEKNN